MFVKKSQWSCILFWRNFMCYLYEYRGEKYTSSWKFSCFSICTVYLHKYLNVSSRSVSHGMLVSSLNIIYLFCGSFSMLVGHIYGLDTSSHLMTSDVVPMILCCSSKSGLSKRPYENVTFYISACE